MFHIVEILPQKSISGVYSSHASLHCHIEHLRTYPMYHLLFGCLIT